MPYKRILVGTDGSETASKAVELAAGLAAALGAELVIAHAGYNGAVLGPAAETASAYGAKVVTEFGSGPPADILIGIAEEKEADLILIGDKGQSKAKHVLLGGVPDRVSRQAACDVLITRTTSGKDFDGYERILIATDGSKTADRAARKGLAMATRLGTHVSLVHVGHPKTGEILLKDTAENLGSPGSYPPDLHAIEGSPTEAILRIAEEDGADLIVVGNKGVAGAKSVLLGSVPLAISQHAACDVLIVRTTTVFASELGNDEGAIITVEGRQIAAYRAADGTLTTLSPRCTHMGCIVGWNAFDKTWDCPCHGSRYTLDGTNFAGPAPKPLEKIEL